MQGGHARNSDGLPGFFRRLWHSAEIAVNRRQQLIFSQFGRSAVSVTRRSLFVESHGRKLQPQAFRVRQRCAGFL